MFSSELLGDEACHRIDSKGMMPDENKSKQKALDQHLKLFATNKHNFRIHQPDPSRFLGTVVIQLWLSNRYARGILLQPLSTGIQLNVENAHTDIVGKDRKFL